jgi:hypothetical protein
MQLKKANIVERGLNFAFANPIGIAATSLLGGGTESFMKTLRPQPLSKRINVGETLGNDFENLNKIGSTTMATKTFGDVLRAKLAAKDCAAPKPEVKSQKKVKGKTTSVKIAAADLTFIDQLISGLDTIKSEKTAGISGPGAMKGLLGSVGMPSVINALNALGLGSIGAMGVSHLYGQAKDAVKKELSYNQMFEEFPELSEMPRSQVDKYWGVLNDFAPKLTTNPLVAGQFISNMASYGMRGIDHNVVGQLAQISGQIDQSSGGMEALRALVGLGQKGFDNSFESLSNIT